MPYYENSFVIAKDWMGIMIIKKNYKNSGIIFEFPPLYKNDPICIKKHSRCFYVFLIIDSGFPECGRKPTEEKNDLQKNIRLNLQ